MPKWKIDPTHARAEFAVRHLMVSTVRGQFENIRGMIEFDPENPAGVKVEATIDATTLQSGLKDRDDHLLSLDFLDVTHHPVIVFESNAVRYADDHKGQISGHLTIRGITQLVILDVDYLGPVETPFGDKRIGVSAQTRINREEFGLNWNMVMETGGIVVGQEVNITVDIEAVLEPEPMMM